MKWNLTLVIIFFSVTLTFGQTPINNSHIAFTIPEKDLLPENIAYDPQEEAFYVGSTRKGKIIKIDKNGRQSVFIDSGIHDQWMIIGMKVDPVRRVLWACSSGGGNLEDYKLKDEVQGRPAGIFKFNLATGELIKKYTLEKEKEVHFFNDLVVDKRGDVYITHMFQQHQLYRITQNTDRLELFHSLEGIRYPNGITLSADEKYLFVAHSDGISRITLATKEIVSLETIEGVKISGKESIDGLYYFEGGLVGIQSDINAVRKLRLDEAGVKVIEDQFLERQHPMMDHPTTGVIVKNELYYIANAQFERFNEDGTLYPYERLYEVIVLKTKLK